jgi:hypothetical protein
MDRGWRLRRASHSRARLPHGPAPGVQPRRRGQPSRVVLWRHVGRFIRLRRRRLDVVDGRHAAPAAGVLRGRAVLHSGPINKPVPRCPFRVNPTTTCEACVSLVTVIVSTMNTPFPFTVARRAAAGLARRRWPRKVRQTLRTHREGTEPRRARILLALAMSGKPGVLAPTNRRAPFVVGRFRSRCSVGAIAAVGRGCEQGGGRLPAALFTCCNR